MTRMRVGAQPVGLDLFKGTVYAFHDAHGECECVARHVPSVQHLVLHHIVRRADGGDDSDENTRWLCPTQHSNVHMLAWMLRRVGGDRSQVDLRMFSAYARNLGFRCYDGMVKAGNA